MIHVDILDFIISYSIIESFVFDEASGSIVETYGLCLEKEKDGIIIENKRIYDITTDYYKIVLLRGSFAINKVTPCTMAEVVEDWMQELAYDQLYNIGDMDYYKQSEEKLTCI